MQRRKYIFLDRDGTIIENVPYLNNPKNIKFVPRLIETLIYLRNLNFRFGVISNQSGVGRGLISYKQMLEVNSLIVNVLASNDIYLDFFLCCLHRPDELCLCRKPKIGLISQISIDFKIDYSNSFMVGDNISDSNFAQNLGIKSILISKENVTPKLSLENILIYRFCDLMKIF